MLYIFLFVMIIFLGVLSLCNVISLKLILKQILMIVVWFCRKGRKQWEDREVEKTKRQGLLSCSSLTHIIPFLDDTNNLGCLFSMSLIINNVNLCCFSWKLLFFNSPGFSR